MNLSEALAEALYALRTPVFGVAGDSNLFLVDAFRRLGGSYTAAVHEGGAVLMAAGYANVSGRTGLATITQGAVTNVVTALSDAARSGRPLVLLTGESPDWDADNVQRVPTARIVRSTGAEYLRLDDPAEAGPVLSLAFARAAARPGPVAVGIPTDLMHAPAAVPVIGPAVPPEPPVPPAEAVEAAARVLAGARRPVVLAGRGAIDDRAVLLALARRLGARVATTLRAKDLFRGDPADLGVLGGLSSGRTAACLAAADTVVAAGAGLNSYTTDQGALLRGKRVVQIDPRPENARSELFLHGTAGAVAPLLLERLDGAGRAPWDAPGTGAAVSRTDLTDLLDALEGVLPPDRLLTVDGGRIFFESVRRLSVSAPRDYVHTMSIGSIGLGLGLAVGAAAAAPERLSVLVTGDGGLMLGGLSEFTTAVRTGARLAVFVLNDGCYGAEHHQLVRRGVAPDLSYFDWPDFAPLGRALGGEGAEVRTPADLAGVARLLGEGRLPLLVDVKLDPERIAMDFTRRPPGAALAEGTAS